MARDQQPQASGVATAAVRRERQQHLRAEPRTVRRRHPHARRGTGQLRTHRHIGRERSVATGNPHTTGNTARVQAGRGLRLTWRGVGSGHSESSGKGMPGTYAVNGSDGSSRGRRQWERSLSGWFTVALHAAGGGGAPHAATARWSAPQWWAPRLRRGPATYLLPARADIRLPATQEHVCRRAVHHRVAQECMHVGVALHEPHKCSEHLRGVQQRLAVAALTSAMLSTTTR